MKMTIDVPKFVSYGQIRQGELVMSPNFTNRILIKPSQFILESMEYAGKSVPDKNGAKNYFITLQGEWVGFEPGSVYVLLEVIENDR
jgi:hypothetical protein